ncbi:MAG TPA: zinc ribbon domain-containing protein [Longimicrobium sp.]|nr:zinc ribbon domain-containing protein [Longimicrobium sp.]
MDALDRLYRRVADVLLQLPDAGATVGDIYQHLVPYRLVRGELAFGELAEYEHALLRLLSGERDYVVVERPEVQEEFRRELRTPNPILGVYRDYAEVGVYLNPFAPEVPSPDLTAPPAPAVDPDATVVSAPEPPKPAKPRPKPCPGCRAPLPTDRDARFCPYCGKCLAPIPCAECSSMVEPEWSFCANCGWPRHPGLTPAAPTPPPPVPGRPPESRPR